MKKYRVYKFTQSGGKFIRDNLAPNPTEALTFFGLIGKIIGIVLNFFIAILIHVFSFGLVGLIYKRGKHPAWVGSLMYTIVYLSLMGTIGVIITSLVG